MTASGKVGREAALTLYRSIRRAHQRHLPNEMRMLGDAYVKSEFKLHKAVTNEAQLDQFFTAWEEYLGHISQTGRRNVSVAAGSMENDEQQQQSPGFGQHLPLDVEFSDEQLGQLDKLREETTKAAK